MGGHFITEQVGIGGVNLGRAMRSSVPDGKAEPVGDKAKRRRSQDAMRRSWELLELLEGTDVYAQIKGVALVPGRQEWAVTA
jgi:hypothetical protein